MDAVDVTGLVKTYGSRTALAGVDLTVRSGTVHGLLGPNGAGKTTLLRCLLGLVAPDAGSARALGNEPGDLSGVAASLAAPAFYPYLSVRENLVCLAALDGGGDVDGSLARVQLADRARQKVAALSSGLRQRLALAAALMREPQLLVLDEPGNSLDPAGLELLHHLVGDLRDAGTTVLLCSHDMGEVEALCDAVTVLDKGSVVLDATAAGLREHLGPPRLLVTTSDDGRAATVAVTGVDVTRTTDGLVAAGSATNLDAWVLALAAERVAVRSMVREQTSMTELFLARTAAAGTS